MSIRTFIFCDICNPQGIRVVEIRRKPRDDNRDGRRNTDGRSWIEGNLSEAMQQGWTLSSNDQHLCPYCRKEKTI